MYRAKKVNRIAEKSRKLGEKIDKQIIGDILYLYAKRATKINASKKINTRFARLANTQRVLATLL